MKLRSTSALFIVALLACGRQPGFADQYANQVADQVANQPAGIAASNSSANGASVSTVPTASIPSKRSLSFISKAPVPAQALPDLTPPTDKANAGQAGKSEGQAGKVPDKYPEAARLEEMIFGKASPELALNDRIGHLESTVFKKTFPTVAALDRLKRLHETLLGPGEAFDFRGIVAGIQAKPKEIMPAPSATHTGATEVQVPAEYNQAGMRPAEDSALTDPANLVDLPHDQLEHYAMDALNQAREARGLNPVAWDDVAYKVATEHVKDLCQHNTISHFSKDAENPDRRYTEGGGSDAAVESIVALSPASRLKPNKATVLKLLRKMVKSQDDRDSLLSPDATHFAFSFGKSVEDTHDRLIGCAMITTKHGMMHPIPKEATIGDKIDVEGVVLPPYRFLKVTLAWEAINPNGRTGMDESDEALPYFPPLDYVAFSQKGEHDWEKGTAILRTAGVVAAIAGGMIIPPVALAAPLIAMAGLSGEPKPISEIPVHGGMKVQGSIFSGKVPINNNGKAGLYYLTVWAQPASGGKPIAVSRRIIVAKSIAVEENSQEQESKPAKKSHKKNED